MVHTELEIACGASTNTLWTVHRLPGSKWGVYILDINNIYIFSNYSAREVEEGVQTPGRAFPAPPELLILGLSPGGDGELPVRGHQGCPLNSLLLRFAPAEQARSESPKYIGFKKKKKSDRFLFRVAGPESDVGVIPVGVNSDRGIQMDPASARPHIP